MIEATEDEDENRNKSWKWEVKTKKQWEMKGDRLLREVLSTAKSALYSHVTCIWSSLIC